MLNLLSEAPPHPAACSPLPTSPSPSSTTAHPLALGARNPGGSGGWGSKKDKEVPWVTLA